jgi:dihydroorotase
MYISNNREAKPTSSPSQRPKRPFRLVLKDSPKCTQTMRLVALVFLLLSLYCSTFGQPYDLLIKNGRVIDPKNKLDTKMDIAISNGKIAKVAKEIPIEQSKKIIDASGFIVVPGLIDMHTHVFVGSKPDTFADGINSVSADDFSFKSGVTTVVDAGTSGWKNFSLFKTQVIEKSQTRILAFLNIAANGMSGNPSQEDIQEMDVAMTAETIQKNKDIIVGVKIGHYEGTEWTPFNRALEASKLATVPIFVECHLPQYSLEEQLYKMRPGDIITHSFENIAERAPIVESGKVRPYVLKAKEKGVLFDVGHGGYGFWFDQAVPAFQQGLAPNTFGTDLHRFSMNAGMKNMLNVMSKYLNMGMRLPDLIQRASWNAALAVKREDLGSLSQGNIADVAILNVLKGKFGFVDAGGNKINGTQKLEAEVTIRAGKIVWDLNGLSAVNFK